MADAINFLINLAMKGVPGVLKGAKAVEQLEKALTSLSTVKMPELQGPSIPSGGRSRGGGATPEQAAQNAAKSALAAAKANAVAMGHENAKMLDVLPALPIKLANGELEQLKQNLREDKLAVTNLSASLRQLQGGTSMNVGTFKLLEAQLQQKKNSLAAIQEKLVLSGNAARFGSEGTNRLTTTLRELAEAAGGQGITGLAGQLQAGTAAIHHMGETFQLAKSGVAEFAGVSEGAAGVLIGVGVAAVAATAAIAALGFGLIEIVKHFGEMALSAAEGKAKTMDMLTTMLGSEEAARALAVQLGGIARVTAVSGPRIGELARELSAASVPADKLADSIKAVAQAESVLPDAGGKLQKILEKAGQTGKFMLTTKQLVGTGINTQALYADIAQRTGKGIAQVEVAIKKGTLAAGVGIDALNTMITNKFGKLAEKRALGLEAQFMRFHENITKLFKDVNVEPFLEAMKSLLGIFDQANIGGKAMHDVLTDVFNGVFKYAAVGVEIVKVGLEDLIIAGLETAIAFKPLLYQLGLIGPGMTDNMGAVDLFEASLDLVRDAAVGTAHALGFIVSHKLLFEGLAIAAGALLAPLLIIPTILFAGAAAFVYIAAKLGEFWDALVFLKDQAVGAGMGFVEGLVEGIATGGISLLVPAIKKLATLSIDTFKNLFQIHSPSRVMMGMGANISLGVARGIPLGMPAVNDNMRRLVSIPSAPTPNQLGTTQRDRRNQTGGGGSAHITVTFAQGAIQLNGGGSLGEMRSQLVDMMADVFEEAALKAGLKVAS